MEKISWDRAARRCSDKLEFFSLSSSPHDEECTQAGQDTSDMKLECKALANQLIRLHGAVPEGAEFFLCRNDHEFGTYYELGIFFELSEEDETPSQQFAEKCEMGIPDNWDAEAISEMKEAGHSKYQPKEPARLVKHQGKIINIKSKTA